MTLLDPGRRRFVLLAPPEANTDAFTAVDLNLSRYTELLAQMQRLRGAMYVKDEAIQHCDCTTDGRHIQAEDNVSWHLLTLNACGDVAACVRFRSHDPATPFCKLTVAKSELARHPQWGHVMRRAVDGEMNTARERGAAYVELGGWAIAEELRCSTEATRMIVAVYALAEILGGAIGITTATVRHCSSSILRRLGGTSLVFQGDQLPSYYDSRHKCEMELLRFDSRRPAVRFRDLIHSSKTCTRELRVLTPPQSREVPRRSAQRMEYQFA